MLWKKPTRRDLSMCAVDEWDPLLPVIFVFFPPARLARLCYTESSLHAFMRAESKQSQSMCPRRHFVVLQCFEH